MIARQLLLWPNGRGGVEGHFHSRAGEVIGQDAYCHLGMQARPPPPPVWLRLLWSTVAQV